jgi:hypothetical protein
MPKTRTYFEQVPVALVRKVAEVEPGPPKTAPRVGIARRAKAKRSHRIGKAII